MKILAINPEYRFVAVIGSKRRGYYCATESSLKRAQTLMQKLGTQDSPNPYWVYSVTQRR
jgi:hypothetical protein